jgi:aminotransferase in exopolysaccharide biosynthesis
LIPLSTPSIIGNEWKYIKECLDTEWVSSTGKYVDLFEEKICEYTDSKYAIACVNGTSALQISLQLAGVEPGDEVIVPTITFIASINAVHYNGAEPIFMDADDYYNIDVNKTVRFLEEETEYKNGYTWNKKTRKRISAFIPVHVFGNVVWLDEIIQLCEEHNIKVVEDAAESMGTRYINGKYSGKHTGTIGNLGCLSFNGNKIITTGGGGMILTDDVNLAEKARYLTTQAKDDRFRYIHDEIGYNFRLTNIQAAMGVAQLEQLPGFMERKREIFREYQTALQDIKGLTLANIPDYADNNHWMNLIRIDSPLYGEDREMLMQRLEKNGIQTRPVWTLNHLQKPYKNCISYEIDNAYKLVNDSLCLPSSLNLTEDEITKIITNLNG